MKSFFSLFLLLQGSAAYCSNASYAQDALSIVRDQNISSSIHNEHYMHLLQFIQHLKLGFLELAQDASWDSKVQDIIPQIKAQEIIRLQVYHELTGDAEDVSSPLCNYTLPANHNNSIAYAARELLSLSIGTLLGVSSRLHDASNSASLFVFISSAAAVDSRYKALLQAIESDIDIPAFDTEIASLWAYNAALRYIEPGSCSKYPSLPVLGRLDATKLDEKRWNFSWDPEQESFRAKRGKQLYIGWTNQLRAPIYTELNVTGRGYGNAIVPGSIRGFTLAGIVSEKFNILELLSTATLAGPAMIDI